MCIVYLLIQVYDAKVTVRSTTHLLHSIRDRLAETHNRLKLFDQTVFSKWINLISSYHDNHLLNYVLQHQRYADSASIESTLKFDIGDHTLELGRTEFCLLTGFSAGKVVFPEVNKRNIPPLVRRLFPEKVPQKKRKKPEGVSYNVKGSELQSFLTEEDKWKKLTDEDAVRVCLLIMSENIFMGREPRHVVGKPIMMLAEDLAAWNKFPWGEYFWKEFYERMVNLVADHRKSYILKLQSDPSSKATYSINGFAWALKVIIICFYTYIYLLISCLAN